MKVTQNNLVPDASAGSSIIRKLIRFLSYLYGIITGVCWSELVGTQGKTGNYL